MTLFESALFGAITCGADPEILLTDPSGKPWGARDCSNGTKESPEPVEFGAIQVDGMALEYNISPARTIEEWVDNHDAVLTSLEERADREGLLLSDASLLHYDAYISTENPTEDELLFGCDPDLNAGTGVENEMPDNDGSIKFRTAGGHVHIGFSNWSETCGDANETARVLIKLLDATLGLWSVKEDDGLERKNLYGKAGAYRVKPYGVEYRTLSNFWVFNEDYMKHVFTTVTNLFSLPTTKLFSIVSRVENMYPEIEKAINTGDVKSATELLEAVEDYINA